MTDCNKKKKRFLYNQKVLDILVQSGIILLSFFWYSSLRYPLLNSDDALNILMAHDYHFPDSLYCWGQDRGGTLIPLLSQIFIKGFHSSAILAVSLSNYLILILGYFALSSLLKTRFSKLVFCVAWFLPFQRFIDLLRFPIGVEYSIIAIIIFIITRIQKNIEKQGGKYRLKQHLHISCIIILSALSIWVSDLSLINLSILLVVLLFYSNKQRCKRVLLIPIIYVILGGVFCFLCVYFAKYSTATKTSGYIALNNLYEVKEALQIIFISIKEVLLFKNGEFLISTYTYLLILFVLFSIAFILKNKITGKLLSNPWFSFFLLDFCAVFFVILLSSWVLANQMGRWYFCSSYIALSFVILKGIEMFPQKRSTFILKIGLTIIVGIGALSPIYSMKYIYPKRLTPQVKVSAEFLSLGEIGIIAEYWNSYINSCPAPDKIMVTPHDKSDVKNPVFVEKVFTQPKLYIIKDMWMDTFPDTLHQFGRTLLKKGDAFIIANSNVCEYVIISKEESIE